MHPLIRINLAAAFALVCTGCKNSPTPPPDHGPTPDTVLFTNVSETHLPGRVRAPGQRSMEARAFDADADGDLDLVVAAEAEPNVLLINDGQGRFTDASSRIPQVALDSEDIAVGDFDGDGDPDVVVVSEDVFQGLRYNEYYLNDGRGSFSDGHDRLPSTGESNAVAAGDVDRDGDLDLIVSGNGREFALINDGRGFFADESEQRLPPAEDVTQDVALGDVDGDGDLDLLVGNEIGPNQLLLNDGRGVFSVAAGSIPLRQEREATRNADFGDVDGDGDLDVFFANVTFGGGHPQSRLLLNDGRGSFSDATAARLPVMTTGTIDGDFVDIDRDGDLDLLTSAFPANRYRAHLNSGSGIFVDRSGLVFPNALSGQGVEIEAADFNGDQRIDIYLANFADSPDFLLLAK